MANCYDEMLSKQEKTVDLRSIGIKPMTTPQVSRYKGAKLLGQNTIQSKKVFGFNNEKEGIKNQQANARTVSPYGFGASTPTMRNRTPIKNALNKSTTNKTPTKYAGTASKHNSSYQQTTAKKYPMTAKK